MHSFIHDVHTCVRVIITACHDVLFRSYQKLHPESKMEGNIDWSKVIIL